MDRVVADDPVLAKRERIARIVGVGKRVGYTALLISIVAFFIGVATSFASWTVAVSIVGLAVSCIVLPLPIVFGYGVRAAAREDRERGL